MSEDKMKNSKRLYWLIPAIALVFAGCLTSVTELVTVPFSGNVTFVDGLVYETVNLDEYDITTAEIETIDKLDFDAVVQNDLAQSADLDLYVAADSTLRTAAAVRASSTVLPVFLGYSLPAGPGVTDTITIPEARAISQLSGDNWTAVKTLILTGKFTVYLTSSATNIQGTVDTANAYITFTGDASAAE
jgi:hypothetical protein